MWHRKERRPSKKAVILVTQNKPRTLLFIGGVVNVNSVIREILGDQESGEVLRTGLRNFQNGIRPSVKDSKFQETWTLDSSVVDSLVMEEDYDIASLHQVGECYWVSWNDLRVTCHLTSGSGLWSEIVIIESLNDSIWIIYHKQIINCH